MEVTKTTHPEGGCSLIVKEGLDEFVNFGFEVTLEECTLRREESEICQRYGTGFS